MAARSSASRSAPPRCHSLDLYHQHAPFHSSPAIRFSGSPSRAIAQFPRSSTRCSAAHSRTSPNTRLGNAPLTNSRVSIASVASYSAFEEAIYVLHAFEKKTRRSRKSDIDRARARLAAVQLHRGSPND